MRAFLSRFIVLNTIGAALAAVAWGSGLAAIIFRADSTYICHAIAAVSLAGLVCAARRDWRSVLWIADKLVFLGLFGTVVGFVMALSGVDPSTAGDASAISPMVARLIAGMGTALGTTLVGAVGYIWLEVNYHLLGGRSEDPPRGGGGTGPY